MWYIHVCIILVLRHEMRSLGHAEKKGGYGKLMLEAVHKFSLDLLKHANVKLSYEFS